MPESELSAYLLSIYISLYLCTCTSLKAVTSGFAGGVVHMYPVQNSVCQYSHVLFAAATVYTNSRLYVKSLLCAHTL